jgi:hypothetical protein
MLIGFLVVSSLVRVVSVGVAARLAGFRRLDVVNLAVTFNARGGPGIVLASVALDAGIISTAFYTTLVVTAVLTSQACGVWLDVVLRRGWPLLAAEGPVVPSPRGQDAAGVPPTSTRPGAPLPLPSARAPEGDAG